MFRDVMEVVFPEFKARYRKGMKHEYLSPNEFMQGYRPVPSLQRDKRLRVEKA